MTTRENLKLRIVNHECTIGSWITIGSTVVAEIMAQAGFDWLVIDMEHSAITLDIAQDMIRVIDLCGVPPLVRVGHNQPNIIKRVMDSGAHGVIVPMVNSKTEAQQAVASVKYPPEGFRGVGLARAQKYGQDFEGYRKWNQENSIVIVQVEHIDAVNNLEDILSVSGVDGFIVGPYDLSGSLGVPGQFENPDVQDALEHIQKVSAKKNAISGFHIIQPNIDELESKQMQGYKFLAFSLDIIFLGNHCREKIKSAKLT
ncbi:HpcH/HpaI aldolase family protein [Desulfonatronovibrio magnus]|uniref:HpcH/HpaI aldolase family protein n=1 Tax=Desulfonatronovibrio magnus TaxID=698827 RepID=UPI0005EBDBFE|nr:aldolase/citrate lyase family protein [Desulfonatronovibrio magnus]